MSVLRIKTIQMKKLLLFAALCTCFSCSYLPEKVELSTAVSIEETPDYISLIPTNNALLSTGIIFYPGGLVDPHAYIETFEELVSTDGRQVVIMKVAANLAITNSGKAHRFIDDFEAVSDWVIGGHSLGGVVACMDAEAHPDAYKGLFLLAAYSISDLSDWDAPVMLLTGELDVVGNPGDLVENEPNLPPRLDVLTLAEIPTNGTSGQTIYHEISGANHAQFGNYGAQAGDSPAAISAEAQQSEVRDFLRTFFNVNSL